MHTSKQSHIHTITHSYNHTSTYPHIHTSTHPHTHTSSLSNIALEWCTDRLVTFPLTTSGRTPSKQQTFYKRPNNSRCSSIYYSLYQLYDGYIHLYIFSNLLQDFIDSMKIIFSYIYLVIYCRHYQLCDGYIHLCIFSHLLKAFISSVIAIFIYVYYITLLG